MVIVMMKKLFTLAASMLVIGSTFGMSHAQQTTKALDNLQNNKFNVTWNLLDACNKYFSITANYKYAPESAVGLFGGMRLDNDLNGYNIGFVYSYATNGNYMSSGWIIKPFVSYVYQDISKSGVSFGTTFTYKWVWGSGVNLQLGLGPAYSTVKYYGLSGGENNYKSFGVAADMNIGMSF